MTTPDIRQFYTELQSHQQRAQGGQKWNAIVTDVVTLYISCIPTSKQEISEARLWEFLFHVHNSFTEHYQAFPDIYRFLFSDSCSSFLHILCTALSDPPKGWWIAHSCMDQFNHTSQIS